MKSGRGWQGAAAFLVGLGLCVAGFFLHNNTGATEIGLPLVAIGTGVVVTDTLRKRDRDDK